MVPSNLTGLMKQMNEAEVVRDLEAARHRAVAAAVRRERSRVRFGRALTRKPSLRTDSQIDIRPA